MLPCALAVAFVATRLDVLALLTFLTALFDESGGANGYRCEVRGPIYLSKNFQHGAGTHAWRRFSASYDHRLIESKWQRNWAENRIFESQDDFGKLQKLPKFYGLPMIPYPSGSGLHVGHLLGYTILDVIVRYKRMQGLHALCPMGWDSFGLPAERFAQSRGLDVARVVEENVSNFKRQLQAMGFGFDWSKCIATSDPRYYRWTQWTFQKFFQNGLAYRAKALVNWCPGLNTVLANEEVVDGKSVRGQFPVYPTFKDQWLLRITRYAQELVDGLDQLEWPESVKLAQRNWIGIQNGFRVALRINGSLGASSAASGVGEVKVFGFVRDLRQLKHLQRVVIGVNFKNLQELCKEWPKGDDVAKLVEEVKMAASLDRFRSGLEQFVDTGLTVVNQLNGSRVPLVVANVPLACGSNEEEINAIFECGAANDADADDVQKGPGGEPFPEESKIDDFSGLDYHPCTITKLRDWIFSRQRYWGEPIPLQRLQDGSFTLADNLPLLVDANASGETMPQWAGSSWHFMRFTDAKNDAQIFDVRKAKYWLPVDLYVGGAEHATLHLLYCRFWTRALYDLGIAPCREPFKKLLIHGMLLVPRFSINGEPIDDDDKDNNNDNNDNNNDHHHVIKFKGQWRLKSTLEPVQVSYSKMSKSKGNVVSPDPLVAKFGADALRCHLLFLGPVVKSKVWHTQGLIGTFRLLENVFNAVSGARLCKGQASDAVLRLARVVTKCIEQYRLNSAVAHFFKFLKHLKSYHLSRETVEVFLKLLSPFAPHLAEELWQRIGRKRPLALEPWPAVN